MSRARVITASSAGTAFEWYDFFIFGTLTAVISKVFFAGLDPTSATLAALGLFAAGFAFRPLGALIFGAIGDRLGRKGAFLATVSLMGGSTFAIGLLPTYQQAGVIAPALLILLRILQGIALGGEYGGAAIYVAEHADDHRRGSATGWIQASASFGLMAALLVVLATRTSLGEEAFGRWGWRIPFLVSAILLSVSIWLRTRLSESPAFTKLREEGNVSRAPLREAFAQRDNLRRVAIAFFGIMCAQGAVWYATFFYMQVFLERSLAVPAATVNLLVMIMTLVSAPLYVSFGWLSDRIGRKPVLLGGMLLALILYFPGSALISSAANPALVAARQASPVILATDPETCSVQFDPVGTARFATACDVAKSALSSRGVPHRTIASPDGSTVIQVAGQRLAVAGGESLSDADLKALKTRTGEQLALLLTAGGYPASADTRQMNYPLLLTVLLLFVVAATALYGPQAAALVELFPTRVRYSALSLPYHVGTGWIGGFLPVTSFALVAITGNIYAGFWYPFLFTLISFVCALLFLKETRGKPLD